MLVPNGCISERTCRSPAFSYLQLKRVNVRHFLIGWSKLRVASSTRDVSGSDLDAGFNLEVDLKPVSLTIFMLIYMMCGKKKAVNQGKV